MFRPIRRAALPALLAFVSVVSLGAADSPVIKFTDVKLKNGLRVIISEDHTAPTVSVVTPAESGRSRSGGFGRLPSSDSRVS